jgi:hypothetical protein
MHRVLGAADTLAEIAIAHSNMHLVFSTRKRGSSTAKTDRP